MKLLALSLFAAALSSPALAQDDGAGVLIAKFMQSWSNNDSKGLSQLYVPDGTLITPDGYAVTGQANLEAFYSLVFASGYAGSAGKGEIVSTRELSPGVQMIDARFSIAGAYDKDGAPRAADKGLMVAVIRKDGADWRIVALRENRGATDITPFAPGH
jgi:uncharacterized protein (TIGR02246 family)